MQNTITIEAVTAEVSAAYSQLIAKMIDDKLLLKAEIARLREIIASLEEQLSIERAKNASG